MKITNRENLPESIIRAIGSFQREYKNGRGDTIYSVTDLLKPRLIRKLEELHSDEIEEDASDLLWALRGQALHKILELGSSDSELTEERLRFSPIPGIVVSGRPDHFDGKTLSDWKECSTWKWIFSDYTDWTLQLNYYAVLYEAHGFPVNELQIVAFFRDWMKSKTRENKYPDNPVKVIPIQKMDNALETMMDKVKWHEDSRTMPDNEIICTPEERWRSESVWAVMKEGRKTAVKLHETEDDAIEHCLNAGSGHFVQERPGVDKRCLEYCRCKKWCPYAIEKGYNSDEGREHGQE